MTTQYPYLSLKVIQRTQGEPTVSFRVLLTRTIYLLLEKPILIKQDCMDDR